MEQQQRRHHHNPYGTSVFAPSSGSGSQSTPTTRDSPTVTEPTTVLPNRPSSHTLHSTAAPFIPNFMAEQDYHQQYDGSAGFRGNENLYNQGNGNDYVMTDQYQQQQMMQQQQEEQQYYMMMMMMEEEMQYQKQFGKMNGFHNNTEEQPMFSPTALSNDVTGNSGLTTARRPRISSDENNKSASPESSSFSPHSPDGDTLFFDPRQHCTHRPAKVSSSPINCPPDSHTQLAPAVPRSVSRGLAEASSGKAVVSSTTVRSPKLWSEEVEEEEAVTEPRGEGELARIIGDAMKHWHQNGLNKEMPHWVRNDLGSERVFSPDQCSEQTQQAMQQLCSAFMKLAEEQRVQLASVVKERDANYTKAVELNGLLDTLNAEVHRLGDMVTMTVASDGFTYDRDALEDEFGHALGHHAQPTGKVPTVVSHHVKEETLDRSFPHMSNYALGTVIERMLRLNLAPQTVPTPEVMETRPAKKASRASPSSHNPVVAEAHERCIAALPKTEDRKPPATTTGANGSWLAKIRSTSHDEKDCREMMDEKKLPDTATEASKPATEVPPQRKAEDDRGSGMKSRRPVRQDRHTTSSIPTPKPRTRASAEPADKRQDRDSPLTPGSPGSSRTTSSALVSAFRGLSSPMSASGGSSCSSTVPVPPKAIQATPPSTPTEAMENTFVEQQPQPVPSRGFPPGLSNFGGVERHPCLRIFGKCNYGERCTYALYPVWTCLNHAKERCRFGKNCRELHLDREELLAYENPARMLPQ